MAICPGGLCTISGSGDQQYNGAGQANQPSSLGGAFAAQFGNFLAAKYTAGWGATHVATPSMSCLESIAYAAHRAVAYDPIDGGCWGVVGMRVPIGDTYASLQAFAEIVNANFAVNGTQPPIATQYALPGPSISISV